MRQKGGALGGQTLVGSGQLPLGTGDVRAALQQLRRQAQRRCARHFELLKLARAQLQTGGRAGVDAAFQQRQSLGVTGATGQLQQGQPLALQGQTELLHRLAHAFQLGLGLALLQMRDIAHAHLVVGQAQRILTRFDGEMR